MNFGLYSFDEQILAWLSADGEDADTFWLDHARFPLTTIHGVLWWCYLFADALKFH